MVGTSYHGQVIFPVVVVDAFTRVPYHGNPAAVCLLEGPAPDAWMQSTALEMNHAETAFLLRRADGGFDLRWFTPGREVDLCGHATLASAHHLWESGALHPDEEAHFHTRSGLLTARRVPVEAEPWIEMDFPAEPTVSYEPGPGLTEALGAKPVAVGRNRMALVAELAGEAEVRGLQPDLRRLAALSDAAGVYGAIVTAKATEGPAQIVSRCFFPALQIEEDPVTGSAHCALGPYWAPRLGGGELLAYQASARGGWLRVRVAGQRVLLRGQAVTTLRGELLRGPA